MSLKLTADLGDLARIRDYVSGRLAMLGVAEEAHDDVRLAVDEAVTNILVHGYGGSGSISLELAVDGQDLVVRLEDEAPGFDPAGVPEADPGPPGLRQSPGGLGLFLIHRVMDEVSQRIVATGNELTLRKKGVVDPASAPG
jgi:serine/threonine-protein kinase RsbW